jgi:hypothetical protein
MGRQLRFFLLPEDVDDLIGDLGQRVGLNLLSERSPTSQIIPLDSASSGRSEVVYDGWTHYERFYLAPSGEIQARMANVEGQGYWHIDIESEVIEFDACWLREGELVQGRIYYQTDLLSPAQDALIPKAPAFVLWAEKIFRRTKKLLRWSKELDAYVGPHADRWQQTGGRFLVSRPFITSSHRI